MTNGNEKTLLQWEVLEPQKDLNSLGWLILSIVASAAVIFYSVSKKEWLMGSVFVLAIFVITWTLLTKTRPVRVAINSKGVSVGSNFYEFEKMRGYWFSPKKQTFNFEQKTRIGNIISFPLGKIDVESIRKYLPDYLTEMKERGEGIFDRISKKIKF